MAHLFISWNSSNNTSLSSQTIEYKKHIDSTWLVAATVPSNVNNYIITGIINNTQYDIRIKGNCIYGGITTSAIVTTSGLNCPTVVWNQTGTSLSYTFPSIGGDLTDYTIQLLNESDTVLFEQFKTNGGTISGDFTGLTPGTTYKTRILLYVDEDLVNTCIGPNFIIPNPPECNITLTFEVFNETTETAYVTVTPTGGVAPYTYSWSNGQTTQTATGLTKNIEYTVTVTDSLECEITQSITPNIEILNGLRLEMMYFDFTTSDLEGAYYPRLCTGGHTCNRARFEVFANAVSQGIANLNNAGGTSIPDGTIDDHNYAPDYPTYDNPSVNDRYWRKDLSGEDAAAIADDEGKVNITLLYTGIDSNPHGSASWIRISKSNGTVVSSECVDVFTGYEFDPYA